MPTSTNKPWPPGWPEYHNANVDACDMAVGPCACGAWHQPGEFVFQLNTGTLFRCGEKVAQLNPLKGLVTSVGDLEAGQEKVRQLFTDTIGGDDRDKIPANRSDSTPPI